jgi:DNA adenine methylase
MKPMIKYRGGKTKEIPSLEKYFPKEFDRYFEPFLGGGAVFFHLMPKIAVLNDINPGLMNFYMDVRDNFEVVKEQLSAIQRVYDKNASDYAVLKSAHPNDRVENKNEALYYKLRDMYNGRTKSEYLQSVLYFFINKTAYSGMIRYNADGEYNVPFGRYKNFNTDLISAQHSLLLKQAELFNGDYHRIFEMAKADDFMFLDPPYDCVFNDYGNLDEKDGFTKADHIELAKEFKRLPCKALLVIGKTDFTAGLYSGMIKGEYFKSYSVNIRNRFKSESQHIVVTNY